jgi:hypothetical protein
MTRPRGVEANVFALKPGSTISARTHARDICEGGSNGPNVLRDGRTLAP